VTLAAFEKAPDMCRIHQRAAPRIGSATLAQEILFRKLSGMSALGGKRTSQLTLNGQLSGLYGKASYLNNLMVDFARTIVDFQMCPVTPMQRNNGRTFKLIRRHAAFINRE